MRNSSITTHFSDEARVVVLTLYLYTTILIPLSIIRQRYFFARLLYCWILHCFVRYYIQKSVSGFICLLFYRERTIKKEKNDTTNGRKESI